MTADVQAPPTTPGPVVPGRRRLDIQGLRAVAVLLVVAFHAQLPLPGGFVGVDVFFVISGFVITAMLMREWDQYGRLRLRHFYFRRFLRLTPALALTVTVVALISVLVQNPFGAQQATARTGIGAMLLAANYVIGHAAGDYFAEGAATNPLLNTWSLSVEEQFYLVFPTLLMLGWILVRRRGGGLRAPVLIVGAVAAGSFALSLLWSFGSSLLEGLTAFFGGPESFAFYSSITRAWEFAAGALLALVLTRLRPLSARMRRAAGLVGGGAIAASALVIHDSDPFPGIAVLLPVTGTVLVILAGTHGTDGVSRLLATRPLVVIGDLSYSWYLWHWPLIVFAALLFPQRPLILVTAAAVSFVPAVISYRFVEQPLRRKRPRTRPRSAGLVVTTLAVPLAACTVLLVGADSGWGLTNPATSVEVAIPVGQGVPASSGQNAAAEAGRSVDSGSNQPGSVADGEVAGGEGGSLRSQHAAVKAGCVNTDLDPRGCRFGPDRAAGTILLAGDSQAYALADGVIAAAASLGYDTIATSHTGCPFLARESSGVHNYPCAAWQKSIVDYAVAERPAAVVIANRSAGYVHPEWDWRTAERDDGGRATSVAEAARLWRAGLEPVVRRLSRERIPVLIMAAVPEMHGYTDRTSLLSQAFGSQSFEVSRKEVEADRRPALDVEESLAAKYDGVAVFDPIPSLCSDDTCSADRDGEPVYQDETHLSVPGSLLLSERLASAISDLVP